MDSYYLVSNQAKRVGSCVFNNSNTSRVMGFFKSHFMQNPLNTDFKGAVYDYIGEWYKSINTLLRHGEKEFPNYFDAATPSKLINVPLIRSKIDKLEGIFRSVPGVPQEITVYRGISQRMYDRIKKGTQCGKLFSDEAPLSASYIKNHLTGRYPYLVEMKVPAGIKAIDIDAALGAAQGENELLLCSRLKQRLICENGKVLKMEIVS